MSGLRQKLYGPPTQENVDAATGQVVYVNFHKYGPGHGNYAEYWPTKEIAERKAKAFTDDSFWAVAVPVVLDGYPKTQGA